ncbi:hypothetical protein BC835DRAFT_940121 [Cytidiella melzeri]|nr:hypothetical protein BC835DRAFT_940121 [Cytidiella melzeri]
MMLSRTSLTASRASPRRTVAVSLLRANSTASPIAQQTPSSTNTTAPRRSIPRASAFADLLARTFTHKHEQCDALNNLRAL